MKYILFLICVCAICTGCDPVKRIQKDMDAMHRLESMMLANGICRPDTLVVTKSDTTIRVDTTAVIYIFTDTVTHMDTTIITRDRLRTVMRTVTIRDTITRQIVDQSALDACNHINVSNAALLAKSQETNRIRGAAIGVLCLFILCMVFFSLAK